MGKDSKPTTLDMRSATRYTGTKQVLASPMTRADYNKYRGWELPADENGDDTGYLVEYTDNIGNPNVEGHAGYVSWSPSDVFEGSYAEIALDTWFTRLVAEGHELATRLDTLRRFLDSDTFAALPKEDKNLLGAQKEYMHMYLSVLDKRAARARDNPQTGPGDPAAENAAALQPE